MTTPTTDPPPVQTLGAAATPKVAKPRSCVRPADLLTALWIGAFIVTGWPIRLALRGPQPVQATVVVAHASGMLAGYGVIVLVGLMSRIPALERGIGADRLARWHSRTGRAVILLILLHAWAAVSSWASSRRESTWLALRHVMALPWLFATTVGTVILLVVAGISIRQARRRVSYEAWHTIHLLVYVGIALSFVHQLAGPDLAGHRLMQLFWALLYTQAFGLVLQYRVLGPVRNARRHRMHVEAVVPEGPGVVSVIVRGEHLHELDAESGQFFRWRFIGPQLWKTAHPFSLSAPPSNNYLRLTVKNLGDGSARIQQLRPGIRVLAEGPYGAMTAHRRTRRDVLLIAGGVGITPMRALFETIPLQPGQDLTLLYRARATDLLFISELNHIAAQRHATVKYLSGDAVGPFTPELFWQLVPGLVHRDVYLCGPPAMASAARRSLMQAGLPEAQLHEERFDF